jgi:hypothetical protein
MMALEGELAERYGYMVTYEDAPADAREVLKELRRDGHEFRYPVWKPVVFHLDVREVREGAPVREALRSGGSGTVTIQGADPARPLTRAVVDSLLAAYNTSGNPGKFTAIYDGDYTHVVPAGRSVNGRIEEFQPILSTIVPMSLQEGKCWDLFQALAKEIQTIRGVSIQVAEWPTNPLYQTPCTVRGHDLPARQVLIQLLDQLGEHQDGFMPNDRFVWTFVHDPTLDAYWLATRLMPGHRPDPSPPKHVNTPPEGRGDTTSPGLLDPNSAAPKPVEKKKQ